MNSLFDDPPHQAHSGTSFDAAAAIKERTQSLRAKLLDWLKRQGQHGGTDEEMQAATKIPSSTQRPRRIELVQKGLVRDSGRTRKTKSNRNAVVWIALEEPCSVTVSVPPGDAPNPAPCNTSSPPDTIPAVPPPASSA